MLPGNDSALGLNKAFIVRVGTFAADMWVCLSAKGYLEATKLQCLNAACEGAHPLLEGSIAQLDVPELVLAGVLVDIGQVLLHGLKTGRHASAVVRMRLLQLNQPCSQLLRNCRRGRGSDMPTLCWHDSSPTLQVWQLTAQWTRLLI